VDRDVYISASYSDVPIGNYFVLCWNFGFSEPNID